MTLQIKEIVASRSFTSSGGFGATRKFVGYDDDVDINADPVDIMEAPGMPSYGQSHPDANGLSAKEFNLTPSAEDNGVWDIVWTYKVFEPGEEGSNPLEPPDTPEVFTRLDVDATVTLIDMYRSVTDSTFATIVPADGQTDGISYPALKEPIPAIWTPPNLKAEGREPVTFGLPTASIKISHDIDALTLNLAPALKSVGTRNNSAWEGYDKGSVLFVGVSISRTAPFKYQITYNLEFDKWFHLRQIPERDSMGQVVLNTTIILLPVINIYWRQPFPEETDFGFIPEV